MRTVNIFEKAAYQDFARVQRMNRAGSLIFKGLKTANPATVYLDAINSLADAVVQGFNYFKQKEITRQLENEITGLKEKVKQAEMQLQAQKIMFANEKSVYRKLLDLAEEKSRLTKEEHNQLLYEIRKTEPAFLSLRDYVNVLRREFPGCQFTKNIEKHYYQAISARNNLLISAVSKTNIYV